MFAFDLKNANETTLFYAGSQSFPSGQINWLPATRQNYWSVSVSSTTVGS